MNNIDPYHYIRGRKTVDEEYVRSLEERVQNLETIVNSIIWYNFPDYDGMARDHFTLYSELKYNAYKKDKKVSDAMDELEFVIKRRSKK